MSNSVSDEQKTFCASLILTAAIMDMAEDEGISRQEARSRIINSPVTNNHLECVFTLAVIGHL